MTSETGLVSRVTPVHTAKRNCTRDGGGPFEFGNQVLISNHRKLPSSKATVVNVAEKVLIPRLGMDCFVLARKRGNARGAKGASHRH